MKTYSRLLNTLYEETRYFDTYGYNLGLPKRPHHILADYLTLLQLCPPDQLPRTKICDIPVALYNFKHRSSHKVFA